MMPSSGLRKQATRFVAAGLSAVAFVTIIIFGGAWNWSAYSRLPVFSSESVIYGALYFAAPLLAILWAHELGHIVVANRYGVRLSLPVFLPSAPPLGTFGALMFVRGTFPNRRALFDIGMAGPVTGFIASVVVTVVGLAFTETSPELFIPPGQEVRVPGPSMAFAILQTLFPFSYDRVLHPTAFAGWAGFLSTAISLLPVGQLDGGHILKAAFERKFRHVSLATVLVLLGMGVIYYGWALLGLLLLPFGLTGPGLRDDAPEIDPKRTIAGALAVALLLLSFVPQPITVRTSPWDLQFESTLGERLTVAEIAVSPGSAAGLPLVVRNTGRASMQIDLGIRASSLENLGFTVNFIGVTIGNESDELHSTSATVSVRASEGAIVWILIKVPNVIPSLDTTFDFEITAQVSAAQFTWRLLTIMHLTESP